MQGKRVHRQKGMNKEIILGKKIWVVARLVFLIKDDEIYQVDYPN